MYEYESPAPESRRCSWRLVHVNLSRHVHLALFRILAYWYRQNTFTLCLAGDEFHRRENKKLHGEYGIAFELASKSTQAA